MPDVNASPPFPVELPVAPTIVAPGTPIVAEPPPPLAPAELAETGVAAITEPPWLPPPAKFSVAPPEVLTSVVPPLPKFPPAPTTILLESPTLRDPEKIPVSPPPPPPGALA